MDAVPYVLDGFAFEQWDSGKYCLFTVWYHFSLIWYFMYWKLPTNVSNAVPKIEAVDISLF
jgi:hypothetical protein